MNLKVKNTLALFTAIFASLIVLSSMATAAVIFSDDFSSGISIPWTITNNPTTLPGTPWTAINQYAEAKPGGSTNQGTTILERIVSTSDFQAIEVKYKRQLGEASGGNGFEPSDEFKVLWSIDGTNYNTLETAVGPQQDPGFVSQSHTNIGASANNNAAFRIRFECTTNAQNEFCRIDDVSIEGTAIPASLISINKIQGTIKAGQNGTFTVKNLGTTALSSVVLTIVESPALSSLSQASIASIAGPGESSQITLTPVNLADLKFGKYTTTVKASASGNEDTETFTIERTFCKDGQVGNLSLRNIDINSDGEEDDIWQPLDEVEVEVDVENLDEDERVNDVQVKMALYSSTGADFADDLDFSSSGKEKIDLGDIRKDDTETATFTFKIPADLDEGDYKLAIKAYSKGDEDVHCADRSTDLDNDFYNDIDVEKETDEDKFVVVDDIKLPLEAACGETVSGTFTVFNIGDEDQDQVLVEMFNTQLGLRKEFEIKKDLNVGKKEPLDFNFVLPKSGITDGFYRIQFVTNYDYDKDDNEYLLTSEDIFENSLKVIGCSGGQTSSKKILVTASLDSEAKAGAPLVVSSVIKNTGTEEQTIIVDASGYETWAGLKSVSKKLITLAPGESDTVTFEFDVKRDASGRKTFLIEAVSGSTTVEVQEVEVNIGKAGGFGFNLEDNSIIWVIAAINIILIVLIILVAVRLSRR